jgi:DNA mismatch endonuclease (patch repair protein)
VEITLRRELWARGLRYFVDRPFLPGNRRRRGDIVFPVVRVAVDCRGCFWHGCPEHGRRDHDVNGWYWPTKIQRNRLRDLDTEQRAATAGWRLLVVWEHDDPRRAADRVETVVRGLRQGSTVDLSDQG